MKKKISCFLGLIISQVVVSISQCSSVNASLTMVSDPTPGYTMDSKPYGMTDVNGKLFFVASDGIHGQELWVCDGPDGKSRMVKDINPIEGKGSYPHELRNINGLLFFADFIASSTSNSLWASDGTDEGTRRVKTFDDKCVVFIHSFVIENSFLFCCG